MRIEMAMMDKEKGETALSFDGDVFAMTIKFTKEDVKRVEELFNLARVMSEENKQDGKGVQIAKYAIKLKKQKADAERFLNSDPKLVELVRKRILLDQEIATLEELPRHVIEMAEIQQEGIELGFAEKRAPKTISVRFTKVKKKNE